MTIFQSSRGNIHIDVFPYMHCTSKLSLVLQGKKMIGFRRSLIPNRKADYKEDSLKGNLLMNWLVECGQIGLFCLFTLQSYLRRKIDFSEPSWADDAHPASHSQIRPRPESVR